MRRFILSGLVLAVVALVGSVFAPHVKGSDSHREVALVEFTHEVVLSDRLLKGDYLIVHDGDKMERGEPCTYVYEGRVGRPVKLIVSFRCRPVKRNKAEGFKVLVSRVLGEAAEPVRVEEIQFAASTEGHRIP